MAKKYIYAEVTNTILEALKNAHEKILPWRKPWRDGGFFPRSGVTGRPYKGVNRFYLMTVAAREGWESNDWFTYKNAKKSGGNVKRGEKSKAFIVHRGLFEVDDEKSPTGKKAIPFLRHFPVFNFEQCEGVATSNNNFVPMSDDERLDRVEKFIVATGAEFTEGGEKACYVPILDCIRMPKFGSFDSPESYYATALHELSHWTGHNDRLDRDLTGTFGSKPYSAEELVAEFSSAFLCSVLKVDGELQHTEYISSWITLLESDKKVIFKCCSDAEKASDCLLKTEGAEVKEAVAA